MTVVAPRLLRRADRELAAAVALALVVAVGCDPPPACAPAALAEIEAAYVTEAIHACQGRTRATCEAMPAIEAKYAAKREAWVRCR